MSYNRPFFEKIGNIFNYSKWKAPNFPAGGERESIPGHVFELYLEASPPASNSTAEQEAADIVTDSSSAAEDVAPVEVSPKKRKLLELAKRATVLVENDCVVFRDRSPVAPVHLLVIPREPIRDVLSLRGDEHDAQLVRRMQAVGHAALKKIGAPEPYTFGFHVPPYNSIPHLHLHCISGPLNLSGKFKIGNPPSKHFVVAAHLASLLEQAAAARARSAEPSKIQSNL
eukprot:INCI5390.1.p1 GENE.INCI5390.1~~INCI5390.1.p1  ORF type:complete len:228 (+),score=38.89 INCI5390.1:233-916(+)